MNATQFMIWWRANTIATARSIQADTPNAVDFVLVTSPPEASQR
jgi:hypothetical protein